MGGEKRLELKSHLPKFIEGEMQVYFHRAKLYRLRDSEWMERALGDFSLWRSVEGNDSKVRAQLRQEKTGKIMLNAWILSKKSEDKNGTDAGFLRRNGENKC